MDLNFVSEMFTAEPGETTVTSVTWYPDEEDTDDGITGNTLHPGGVQATKQPHVADAGFDRDIRIVVLYVEIILGAIGGFLVLFWLWYNWYKRRNKTRVNMLILHVAISDLLVIFGACLMQLVSGSSYNIVIQPSQAIISHSLIRITHEENELPNYNALVRGSETCA